MMISCSIMDVWRMENDVCEESGYSGEVGRISASLVGENTVNDSNEDVLEVMKMEMSCSVLRELKVFAAKMKQEMNERLQWDLPWRKLGCIHV